MKQTRQLLERGFSGGIVIAAAFVGFTGFLYVVYRLIKSLQPKKVRQEEQRIRSHRFYKVSGRGRAAYLILCIEQALLFYEQDFPAWEWVLRELWSITDRSEGDWIGTWLDSVEMLLPSTVLTNHPTPPSSDKMREIQTLYTRAGTAMIVVNSLMEIIYAMVCEWSPGAAAHDPDALHFIDEAEERMEQFGVPLPADKTVRLLASQKDYSIGNPFDGLGLSYLLKKCAS